MAQKVEPIPHPEAPLTPYITVKGGAKAIDFYKKAFGAEEISRMTDPTGTKIMHAELKIGTAHLMLCDEFPEMGGKSPETLGGTPVMLHLYVKDVDAFTERAVNAGLKVIRKVEDQFYGDRGGSFADPFGNVWWISTHKEDVSKEELERRSKKMFEQQKSPNV
ncbi:MAG: VOC family protein [Bdellovibrio sp.]